MPADVVLTGGFGHDCVIIGDLQSVDCQAVHLLFAGMDTRKVIGWNLRRLRVAQGLSQERLALKSGIDRSYVGQVERGSENVTVARLEQFAAILGVPVRDLFDEEVGDSPPPALAAGRKPKQPRRPRE